MEYTIFFVLMRCDVTYLFSKRQLPKKKIFFTFCWISCDRISNKVCPLVISHIYRFNLINWNIKFFVFVINDKLSLSMSESVRLEKTHAEACKKYHARNLIFFRTLFPFQIFLKILFSKNFPFFFLNEWMNESKDFLKFFKWKE